MAAVVEDLVFSSVVSSTGVTDWNNTTANNGNFGIIANTNGNNIIFELTNLSQTPTSITDIQYFADVFSGAGSTQVIQHEFLNSSNTQLYTENEGYSTDTENQVSGTVRTTSDGSTAWTENDINTLRVKLTQLAGVGGGTATCDHFFVRVKYNVADPTAGLIKLNSGKIKLNSGLVKIIV
jgi:hypothetical protein